MDWGKKKKKKNNHQIFPSKLTVLIAALGCFLPFCCHEFGNSLLRGSQGAVNPSVFCRISSFWWLSVAVFRLLKDKNRGHSCREWTCERLPGHILCLILLHWKWMTVALTGYCVRHDLSIPALSGISWDWDPVSLSGCPQVGASCLLN